MFFQQPWMLLGLGLCALPILLHLLLRRTYRREPWAAMRFLRAALDRRARQLRIESLLLLLVRVLLVMVIVLAVAEPLFRTFGGVAGRAPRHRILVVDLSASLGAQSDGERRIDKLRQAVHDVLDQAIPGDLFQLVRLSTLPPHALIRRGTPDPDEVRMELDRWPVTEEAGDVAAGLRAVQELLPSADPQRACEVIVFTDLQRSNWQPEGLADRHEIQRLLSAVSLRCGLRFVDVSGGRDGNLGVIDVACSHAVLAPSQPTELAAVVRNYGRTRTTFRGDWLLNGVVIDSDLHEVDGNADATPRLRTVAPIGATLQVEFRLSVEDSLAVDNRRCLAVAIRPALQVLLVEGRPGLSSIEGAAGFLRLALQPPSANESGDLRRMPLRVSVVSESELPRSSLADVDCLWLCDLPELPADQRRRVADFVQAGGGLVFSVGEQTVPGVWNDWNAASGQRVLPGVLLSPTDAAASGADQLGFRLEDVPHAATADFVGNPLAGLETTRIRRFLRVNDQELSGTRILSFSDGSPALLEQTVGLGRVVLVLTGVDDRWGNWAVWPSFLPLVQRLTVLAASSGDGRRQLDVGTPIERRRPPSQQGLEVRLTDPAGQQSTLTPRCDAEQCEFRFSAVSRAGFYTLETGPPLSEQEVIAVNVPTVESALASLDEAAIAGELLPNRKFELGGGLSTDPSSIPQAAVHGSLSGLLLLTALALLTIEKLLAWRPRVGAAALAGLGILAASLSLRSYHPWSPAALLLAIVVAAILARRSATSPR